MADEVAPEPTPVEPPVEPEPPNFEELLAEKEKQLQELEQNLNLAKADADAKMNQLEQIVSRAFTAPDPPPPPPVTPDQFEENQYGATAEMIQREVAAALEKNNQQVGAVMRGMAESAFSAQYNQVAQDDMFPHVKDKVDKFFNENPAERMKPGSVENVFTYYLGEHVRQHGAPAAPSPPTPTPAAPVAPEPPAPKPELDAQKERLARAFGIESAEEWESIEKGDKYPKRARSRR